MRSASADAGILWPAPTEALADHAPKQVLHVFHQAVQIDHPRLEELLAAESQQLARQSGGSFAGFANQIGMLPNDEQHGEMVVCS